MYTKKEPKVYALKCIAVCALTRDTGFNVLVKEVWMVLFICFFDQNLGSMMAYVTDVEMPENPWYDLNKLEIGS